MLSQKDEPAHGLQLQNQVVNYYYVQDLEMLQHLQNIVELGVEYFIISIEIIHNIWDYMKEVHR